MTNLLEQIRCDFPVPSYRGRRFNNKGTDALDTIKMEGDHNRRGGLVEWYIISLIAGGEQ